MRNIGESHISAPQWFLEELPGLVEASNAAAGEDREFAHLCGHAVAVVRDYIKRLSRAALLSIGAIGREEVEEADLVNLSNGIILGAVLAQLRPTRGAEESRAFVSSCWLSEELVAKAAMAWGSFPFMQRSPAMLVVCVAALLEVEKPELQGAELAATCADLLRVLG